jgi:predicted lipoprotein with Yx(FWY)xxD motif
MRAVLRLAALTAVVVAASTAAAGGEAAARAPFGKQQDARFGAILVTRGHKALYFWRVERDFKVHCTGACARAWPPLVVRTRAAVPRRVRGITGTFGVIRRPDGTLQVTHNRRPVYTYAHEGPNQVLCDNVDGWFVVRL